MKRHTDHFDANRRDRETITAVRHRIEHARHKGLRRVKATISGGAITLSGTVPTEGDRELAIELAGGVPFVEGIVDDIEVASSSLAAADEHS